MTHRRSNPADERDRKSLWAINLGLGFNIILSAAKTTFGILTHSPALLAEGINSTSDVAYYVVASIFMRLANKPADEEHPYGHRQLESIASLVVGAFVKIFRFTAVDREAHAKAGVSTKPADGVLVDLSLR